MGQRTFGEARHDPIDIVGGFKSEIVVPEADRRLTGKCSAERILIVHRYGSPPFTVIQHHVLVQDCSRYRDLDMQVITCL